MTTLQGKQMKILNLLRFIYDECKNDYTKISLTGKAEEYEIPGAWIFCKKLIVSKILDRKGEGPSSYSYKWNLETGPTVEMVEKYFGTREYTSEEIKKESKHDEVKLTPSVNTKKSDEKAPNIPLILKDFSTIDLINELKHRGFSGTLHQSFTI